MKDQELKENILKALSKGIRTDGRLPEDVRDIEIEFNVVEMAEGSARVKFGDTEVIAGVKLKLDKPYSDTPNEGVLMVNIELTPLSNPEFESGPPSVKSIEIARVIDRGIREGHAIDNKKLCVEPGEKVWCVNVDISPINTDGNLLDIGGLAALAALHSARFPKVKDGVVNYNEKTDEKLPVLEEPIPVTVLKIGESFIVDPTNDEEKVFDSRLTATFRSDGNLCAIQKGGDGPLTTEDISKMLDLAQKTAGNIREIFTNAKN